MYDVKDVLYNMMDCEEPISCVHLPYNLTTSLIQRKIKLSLNSLLCTVSVKITI